MNDININNLHPADLLELDEEQFKVQVNEGQHHILHVGDNDIIRLVSPNRVVIINMSKVAENT